MRHRILLVREWDAQHTGSGCCGRLGGQGSDLAGAASFQANRCEMEAMGEVYRALRAALPRDDVELTVVDPRNTVWLLPAIWRDARRQGMSAGEVWRQLRRGMSYNAVIVDGRVLFSGHVPAPDDALAAVRAELASV